MPRKKGKFEENHGLPSGLSHFSLLSKGVQLAHIETDKRLNSYLAEQRLLGTCLCALYQAATCHRECHKGSHLLEALCARAYNQACAAFHLLTIGLYDESLNLVRGIGEIYELVALSTVDQDAVQRWIASDRATRIREFSPGKVRARLRELAPQLILTDRTWYSDLSERYTHVNPTILPNRHNPDVAVAGGVFQEEGLKLALEELTQISCGLALFICRYFGFLDLFAEIKERLKELPEDVSPRDRTANPC